MAGKDEKGQVVYMREPRVDMREYLHRGKKE